MPVAAGHEGVAGRQPVNQSVFHEIVQNPVDRDRGWALARGLGHPVDHLIGAERPSGGTKLVEHPAAGGGEFDAVAMGACGIVRAMRVIAREARIDPGGGSKGAKPFHGAIIGRPGAGIDSGCAIMLR